MWFTFKTLRLNVIVYFIKRKILIIIDYKNLNIRCGRGKGKFLRIVLRVLAFLQAMVILSQLAKIIDLLVLS
jgi:hypothetical protein